MLAFVAACQPTGPASTDATTGTSTGAPTTTSLDTGAPTTTDGTPTTETPVECMDLSSPFLAADCLVALRNRCLAATDEATCTAREPLLFGDGGYIIRCGWAKVVTFADPATCAVESVVGRCEAGLEDTLLGCGNHCNDENSLQFSLRADVDAAELLEMGCASNGNYLDGPLGARSAVGAEPQEFGTVCIDGVKPPAPPLCDCASAACATEWGE
ncbi:hypothetical protein [Nannocystis punicea]|uniref:Lipoprotein n=1 Tax=Nannocystis punicea TaxID=2995304 RepID=A0ABY7H548_9BACT|nr:hypothetical protein [Nannocystis poenicansa]WAS94195.1 hypothetical protein O0S08_49365 [Nannocystis poenicansa]